MKKYFNKRDIEHYLTYGPMDFEFKQAMFYFLIFDIPIITIFSIVYTLIKY